MATYKYRAKKGPKEVTEGTIEAESENEAIEKVIQMGYVPVRMELYQGPLLHTSPVPGRSFAKSVGRIKSNEITIFSREFASLLKSGVPILSAISIIKEQSENLHLRLILDRIHDAVKDGATFSGVLGEFPSVFSSLYIAMVRTGEDSGALPQMLLRIADHRARQEELFSRFRMALAYPILMALVGIGTIIFMLTFVMPRLMKIFVTMGQTLPLATRILISVSVFLRQWWVWAILFLVIILIKREMRTKAAKLSLSLFVLRIPLFGKFIIKAELSRFNRTLELLIRNGVPILKSLEIAIPVIDNEIIRTKLALSHKDLTQGSSFGKSLKTSKLFPPFMCNLITVGEESGRLEEALSEIASSYERDTEEALRVLTSLLEPLMILVMGLIVGFIVMAMLLPIFEINMMVK
ncbi:MAG: type II secretion system F family protein [Candidatus Omnitrophota bacterium]